MVNVVTNTRIITDTTSNKVTQYVTIASDGSEEADVLVYDSSAVAAALGITDPLDCTILNVWYTTNSVLAVVHLDFEATADVLALALPQGGAVLDKNFEAIGGLKNTAGTGITGDVSLTTTGLVAGDGISLTLEVLAR